MCAVSCEILKIFTTSQASRQVLLFNASFLLSKNSISHDDTYSLNMQIFKRISKAQKHSRPTIARSLGRPIPWTLNFNSPLHASFVVLSRTVECEAWRNKIITRDRSFESRTSIRLNRAFWRFKCTREWDIRLTLVQMFQRVLYCFVAWSVVIPVW